MNSDSRRLTILTAREIIDDLYGLPRFTDDERRLYFDLSAREREALDAMHAGAGAVHLVLQIGYFKARRQFFIYGVEDVPEDSCYVLQHYFPDRAFASVQDLSKAVRFEQQQIILAIFDYRRCDSLARAGLESKARRIAMLSTRPVTILRETLQYLENQRLLLLAIPSCRISSVQL